MYICYACIKRERHVDSLKAVNALNFTSSFRSDSGVNAISRGRKNKSLKSVYRSNRCFISDSYKTYTQTAGPGYSIFEGQTWRWKSNN